MEYQVTGARTVSIVEDPLEDPIVVLEELPRDSTVTVTSTEPYYGRNDKIYYEVLTSHRAKGYIVSEALIEKKGGRKRGKHS